MRFRGTPPTPGLCSAHPRSMVKAVAVEALADLCLFAVPLGRFRCAFLGDFSGIDAGVGGVFAVEVDYNGISVFARLVLCEPDDSFDLVWAVNNGWVGGK